MFRPPSVPRGHVPRLDEQRLVAWANAKWSLEAVDRRPQDFLNGTPNGITDNTLAIQAAIDAGQPGDQVVLSGGTFRTSNKLSISPTT